MHKPLGLSKYCIGGLDGAGLTVLRPFTASTEGSAAGLVFPRNEAHRTPGRACVGRGGPPDPSSLHSNQLLLAVVL